MCPVYRRDHVESESAVTVKSYQPFWYATALKKSSVEPPAGTLYVHVPVRYWFEVIVNFTVVEEELVILNHTAILPVPVSTA